MQNSSDAVLIEREDAVAWVTLNRPDAMNAINDAIREALPAALRSLDADEGVRVIVLRGAGPRAFCAGADLREVKPRRNAVEARVLPSRAAWMDAFDEVKKPLVAAVHGFCLGGGFEIALACDLRIATADATFALPETGLGLIPGGGGTQRLPRLIGAGPALQLMMTGDRIDAQEALRLSIVSRVLPDTDMLTVEARRIARQIAARPPLAIRFVKEAVQCGMELDLRRGIRLERDLFGLLAATEDSQEAVAAFREKRAPVFSGR